MKKSLQSLLVVFISSISLTSCCRQEDDQAVVTRKASNNIIYLHQYVTRFDSSQEAFQEIINSNDRVVVDFYADWCGPCKRLGAVIEQVAPHYSDVVFLKVNTDQFKELSRSIRSIPVLAFYRNGREVKRVTGSKSKKELTHLLNSW